MKLEYVASGASFFRIDKKESWENADTKRKIEKAFEKIAKPNHSFSILYNGYTEKKNPDILRRFNNIRSLYADSGGLQVMTTGAKVTNQILDDIFESQSKSDYAFSFEYMPVVKSGEKSKRLDLSSRYFDKDNFDTYIQGSANNLQRQIEYFDKKETNTKIFYILHGNTLEDYTHWLEYTKKLIGPSKFDAHVGGIALGASGLGIGKLEEIKKAFYTGQFLKEFGHIHILGIGSYPKILPYLHFGQSGYFPKDALLSYDSTTQSCCPNFGRWFSINESSVNLTRDFSNKWIQLYNELKELFGDDFNYELSEFYDVCNMPCINDKHDINKSILSHFFWAIGCMVNFVNNTEKLKANLELGEKFTDEMHHLTLMTLGTVKDVKDFNEWLKWHSSYVSSIPISVNKAANLEDLFV